MEKVECPLATSTYKHRTIAGALGYLAAFALIIAGEFTYQSVVPFEFFTDYQLDVIQGTYTSDKPMRFESIYTHERQYDVEWDNTLFCDDPIQGFVSYPPVQITQLSQWKPEHKRVVWRYTGGRPEVSTECYLQGTMTITTELGVKKTKIEKTPIFNYIIK